MKASGVGIARKSMAYENSVRPVLVKLPVCFICYSYWGQGQPFSSLRGSDRSTYFVSTMPTEPFSIAATPLLKFSQGLVKVRDYILCILYAYSEADVVICHSCSDLLCRG